MAKKGKRGPTPEDWARWQENQDRMERVLERALAEIDPAAAARRAELYRISRGSGPEARAAERQMWRDTDRRNQRMLDRIRAEESERP